MYLIQKIEDLIYRYPDARGTVGQFVLEQKENLGKLTIGQVAEQCYTSKATVVRFAKILGYDGWRDFLKDYLAEIQYAKAHPAKVDVNYPFTDTDDIKAVALQLRDLEISSLEETEALLDAKTLELARDRIRKADEVVIFGISPNSLLAETFRRKLISIGLKAKVAPNSEMGLTALSLTDKDCAMIISYSGNDAHSEPMAYIRLLQEKHVPMIGITSAGENYMRQVLDCVLTIASREHLYSKIANYYTEQSILYILNVLYAAVFQADYEGNKKRRLQRARILEYRRYVQLEDGAASHQDPEN